MTPSSNLVAVLSNPPLTSGDRTLGRIALAAKFLGATEVTGVNLFSLASHRTGAISELGSTADGWAAARQGLRDGLLTADAVLLAYGTSAPSGSARTHFVEQVEWLWAQLDELNLPCWQVGDGPRHPSRWQRWTHRAHPGVPFVDALALGLVRVRADSVGPSH